MLQVETDGDIVTCVLENLRGRVAQTIPGGGVFVGAIAEHPNKAANTDDVSKRRVIVAGIVVSE